MLNCVFNDAIYVASDLKRLHLKLLSTKIPVVPLRNSLGTLNKPVPTDLNYNRSNAFCGSVSNYYFVQILDLHPAGRAFSSDCCVNSFIIVVYEKSAVRIFCPKHALLDKGVIMCLTLNYFEKLTEDDAVPSESPRLLPLHLI